MFKSYLITAWRNLKRSKFYSAINIIGLSMGLACAMLIVLYVKDEVSFDRFHTNHGSIYRVVNQEFNPDGSLAAQSGSSGFLQGPRFSAAIPDIRHFTRFRSRYMDIKEGDEIKGQQLFETDSSFFSVFSFPLLKGNPATALKQPRSMVLSADMARRQFGSLDVLGKTLALKENDTFEPYTVTGVAANCPQNSSIRFDILTTFVAPAAEEANTDNWFNFFLNTFVVLQPGANQQAVEKKMQAFYKKDAGASIESMMKEYGINTSTVYSLQPLAAMHLSTDMSTSNGLYGASNPMYSYILSAIAVFILIIACINFVNLTVARSVRRAKEIGIRKVVGGDRRQLIAQFLGESFVLCLIAFVLAIGLVELTLPVFNKLSSKALSLSYLMDAKLVAGYILLLLLTGLLAGFYPALVLSGYNPVKTLYNRFNLAGKNYLQKSLVVLQFALASFLIAGTFTIFSQFTYLTSRPLGYDDSNLAITNVWGIDRNQAKLMRDELLRHSSIASVARKNSGDWGTVARVNGEQQLSFAYETIDETYIPQLKMQLVAGRNFSPDLVSDTAQSVLVNEAFVKEAGWQNPLGQEVNFWYNNNKKYTVIGVVKDYHFESLNTKIRPQLFTMNPGNAYGQFLIKIKEGHTTAALAHLEKTFRSLFPVKPFSYQFMDQQNLLRYEAEKKWSQILLFSAALTIFISCIGLFGLAVLAAEKRTKEIGIRKVLGASVPGIAASLSKDFIKLVLLSLVISIPCAWLAGSKWLDNYPYRVALSWTLFIQTSVLVIIIALLTIGYQSVKAALANPVKALRTE